MHLLILKDADYWKFLKDVYVYKALWHQQEYPLLKAFFNSTRNDKKYLMTKREHEYLQALPDKIMIYRGMSITENQSEQYGISWSLKRSIAERFAGIQRNTFDIPSTVHELFIDKEDVTAYFNGRDEFEIIYCK